MQIIKKKISQLKPSPYNPRKDLKPGDLKYEKLKKSILEFTCVEPIVWNKRSGNVVGGHQRLKILKELKHKEIEVSVVDLPNDKEKALNIVLNNPNAQGEYDLPVLEEILNELNNDTFDIELTGFNIDEIEDLLKKEVKQNNEEDEEEIKKGLREGIMVIIGWYQILVRPEVDEFNKLWSFAGTNKRWSEEEKQEILKRIYDAI